MISLIFKLYKIMASNTNLFSQFTDGIKKGPKGIIKSILLILLGIYLIVAMGTMYVFLMIGVYNSLSASGTVEFMPLISMMMAASIILFFGFTSVAASYYTGNVEEQLLTMPVTPAQFFAGKFSVAFVSDAVFALAMFAISSVVYGYNEGLLKNPLFYLGTIVSALSFSIAAVFLIYFIFVLFLYFIPVLRKRKILSGIATFCVIAFALVYGMANSLLTSLMNNSQYALGQISGVIEKITNLGSNVNVLLYFSQALNGKIIPILVLALITAVILFVFVPLTGRMYIKTLNGFSDVKTKKITSTKAEEVIQKDVHSVSIFQALFVRDLRNVIREPAFFTNGPLFTFIFPVILFLSFGIGFVVQGDSIGDLIQALQLKAMEISSEQMMRIKYYVCLALTAYTVFSGTFANIATTAFPAKERL